MLRPEGPLGVVVLDGRGRDLVTSPAGEADVAATARLAGTVDYTNGRILTALETEPATPASQQLLGLRASSGFRARVDEELPAERAAESLVYQLLDDLPIATLISGIALTALPLPPLPPSKRHFNEDLCSGWRSGGTIMVEIERSGRPPLVTGPDAPPVVDDDVLGWHELPPLPVHGVRRQRRTDVWLRDDGLVAVDSFYRDSHVDADGLHTVIHEYTVAATVDPTSGTFVDSAAQPRTLPWEECPAAAGSATRIAGVALADVRETVRSDFTGTSTCTHLNDQLRSLAGVRALLPLLLSKR